MSNYQQNANMSETHLHPGPRPDWSNKMVAIILGSTESINYYIITNINKHTPGVIAGRLLFLREHIWEAEREETSLMGLVQGIGFSMLREESRVTGISKPVL